MRRRVIENNQWYDRQDLTPGWPFLSSSLIGWFNCENGAVR